MSWRNKPNLATSCRYLINTRTSKIWSNRITWLLSSSERTNRICLTQTKKRISWSQTWRSRYSMREFRNGICTGSIRRIGETEDFWKDWNKCLLLMVNKTSSSIVSSRKTLRCWLEWGAHKSLRAVYRSLCPVCPWQAAQFLAQITVQVCLLRHTQDTAEEAGFHAQEAYHQQTR